MTERAPTRSLTDIADQANEYHRRAETAAKSAIEYATEAGKLLIEAKQQVRHGEWMPWLKANVAFSERTAQGYMRVARNTKRVADLPLREALKTLAEPKPIEDADQDADQDVDHDVDHDDDQDADQDVDQDVDQDGDQDVETKWAPTDIVKRLEAKQSDGGMRRDEWYSVKQIIDLLATGGRTATRTAVVRALGNMQRGRAGESLVDRKRCANFSQYRLRAMVVNHRPIAILHYVNLVDDIEKIVRKSKKSFENSTWVSSSPSVVLADLARINNLLKNAKKLIKEGPVA